MIKNTFQHRRLMNLFKREYTKACKAPDAVNARKEIIQKFKADNPDIQVHKEFDKASLAILLNQHYTNMSFPKLI